MKPYVHVCHFCRRECATWSKDEIPRGWKRGPTGLVCRGCPKAIKVAQRPPSDPRSTPQTLGSGGETGGPAGEVERLRKGISEAIVECYEGDTSTVASMLRRILDS